MSLQHRFELAAEGKVARCDDALAQARSQAVTARDMAASIAEKIAGPADEVAKLNASALPSPQQLTISAA